ncbi:unannotated protein [freshwater metagenome]|uniref:Unannotated protein n=1 Tax=freshwater metagenome TaxID=449393 RepID=A0A6J6C2Y4_9ZZZZ|nr:hypothetical protein [Actinomycetota bacterium]MTA63947.1 hypothetical protein [Actinomycetota bacterium]
MSDVDDQTHLDPSHGLFSTVASDNVEIVGQASTRASEGLWTVAAKPDPESQTESVEDDLWTTADPTLQDGSGLWTDISDDASEGYFDDPDSLGSDSQEPAESIPRPFSDSMGSVFSADPVDHFDDSIDEAEVIDNSHMRAPVAQEQTNPLFSSGPDWETFSAPSAPSAPSGAQGQPVQPGAWTAAPSAPPRTHEHDASSVGMDFETAVGRLQAEEAEAAHVALAVCGALLPEGERVIGLVTGQMLGRPAAVLVTEYRVVIANDRRWTPVVDVFAINGELTVRGRQDREVAALSFSDRSRVSMVDGIPQVSMAVELANLIRGSGEQIGW